MKKTVFILACLCSISIIIKAQVSKPLIFTHYTKKEGLASNNVLQILQDKTGFIWLGTDNGLQRYDGNKFVTFHHSAGDTTSIPDNVVHKVFLDSKDRLWLACGKKIGIFNKSTLQFKEVNIVKVNAFSIRKLMEDEAGRIIVFFGGGKMYWYNEASNLLEPEKHMAPVPEGWSREEIVVDPETKRYWITGKTGLMLYDPKTKQYSYRGHNVLNDSTIARYGDISNTRHFFIDKKGRHWMVSWVPFKGTPELYSYDRTTHKVSTFKESISNFAKAYFEIWGVAKHNTGSMWVSGLHVLGSYDDASGNFRFISSEAFRENSISYDHVLYIYDDRENNTWIGTNMGLYRCNPAAQQFVNVHNFRLNDTTVYQKNVTSLLQTKKNGLWACTWGDGIFSYDQNMRPIPNPITDADPQNKTLHGYCLLQTSSGEIWAGMRFGAMKVYDPATGKVSSTVISACEGGHLRQMVEDNQKNVWMISDNGLLLKCKGGNWRDTTSIQVIQRVQANNLQLYIDKKNNVWVGTDWAGLLKVDGQTGKLLAQYKEQTKGDDGLMQDGASDIIQYNDSIYLIAANGINILNANTGRFKFLTQADGMPADGAVSFVRDGNNVFIGLANGFCRLNMDKMVFVPYDVQDGITNNSFESASAAYLPNGLVAMGTLHNFILFDPKKVAAAQRPPNVVVTSFTLGNKLLSLDSLMKLSKINLRHNKSAINIEFSTLTYSSQYKISYMLEGFDQEWKTAGSMPQAIYTYLPIGSYTFKVRAENGDGVLSPTITTIQIKVNPPFWKTWWFYGIVALIIAVVYYRIDRARVEKRAAMQAIRTQIAGNLHHEINTTLNNITLLSEMAKLKADKDPVRSKEYIDQIHDKSRRMRTAMDDILWSIDPANDSMEKTLLRMSEFTQALKNQYGTDVEVTVDEKVRSLHLEMKRRHEFFILYTEALRAIIEYARSKATLVNIDFVKNKLSLKLSGNTDIADRSKEEIDSCLNEVSKSAETMGAELDVQTTDQSMFIEVMVPVR